MLRATQVLAPGESTEVDVIHLDYESRMVRRKRLVSDGGLAFVVDLPQVVSLDDGALLRLEDGRCVRVAAADEVLLQVTGDLPRLAWHIGNRHTPCQILGTALIIRNDPVLRRMLEQLGAGVTEVTGPFRPEGGAYGHGRTMGHSHGPDDHDHAHDHDHHHHHAHHHD